MTFNRNIPEDQHESGKRLEEYLVAGRLPEHSWLGHSGGNAQIDILLIKGAKLDEMANESGRMPSAVNAHINHLRREHGLQIVREGELYRFVLNNVDTPSHAPVLSGARRISSNAVFPPKPEQIVNSDTSELIDSMHQLRKTAQERLRFIESSIRDLDERRQELVAEQALLLQVLGQEIPAISHGTQNIGKRQGHGVLREACIEALTQNAGGLTSSEVVRWLVEMRPEVVAKSAPAVLSRLAKDKVITRDSRGIYHMTPSAGR